MFYSKIEEIRNFIQEGTGAEIGVSVDRKRLRTAVDIWFSDFNKARGPVIRICPSGLKRHKVELRFGGFSGNVLQSISKASEESRQLAKELIRSTEDYAKITFSEGMCIDSWEIRESNFKITCERLDIEQPNSVRELQISCEEIVVPLMGALAELIGYESTIKSLDAEPELDGAISRTTIIRRERNARNRLLCFRLHGYKCAICDLDPGDFYGRAGRILEVHHLQPLSIIDSPRIYDPKTDLVPLCPNCHKAVHTKRPIPWTPSEVKEMLRIRSI